MWKKARPKQHKSLGNSISSNDSLNKDLNENVAQIKEELGNSSDLIVLLIKHKDHPSALGVVHIDGISNTQNINEHIIEPLLTFKSDLDFETLKDVLEQTIARG